jgi:hypothetical protein
VAWIGATVISTAAYIEPVATCFSVDTGFCKENIIQKQGTDISNGIHHLHQVQAQ